MKRSKHFEARTNQRGINQGMLELAYQFGVVDHRDRTTLSKKAAQELMEMFRRFQKQLKKVIDKGGIELVEEEGTLVTAYRLPAKR